MASANTPPPVEEETYLGRLARLRAKADFTAKIDVRHVATEEVIRDVLPSGITELLQKITATGKPIFCFLKLS